MNPVSISSSDAQAIAAVLSHSLPALSGSAVHYNKEKNIFLSDGWTSAAGNTYFQGQRISDRLIVNYDLGQGDYYLFINGIRLYCFDGKETKLLCSCPYSCTVFTESFVKRECARLLKNFILSQAAILGKSVSEDSAGQLAGQLAEGLSYNQNLLRA